jgi:Xaa-Pro dipeptidase
MFERAVAVADAAIFHLGYDVRVGMTQTEALSILEAAILRAGGDPGHQTRWECGPAPKGIPGRALPVPLHRFDVSLADLTPSVAGYGARELHPVCVGKPPQRVYEMFELACNVFSAALPLLTPGRSSDAWLAAATQAAADSPYEVRLDVAAAGLADHRTASAEERPTMFQDQQVLTVNAVARDADGTSIAFCTTVVVTPEGGRRLSKRPLELMLTSRSFLSAYTEWRSPEPTAPWLSPS